MEINWDGTVTIDPEELAYACLAEDANPRPLDPDVTYEEAMELLEQSTDPIDHASKADFEAAVTWMANDWGGEDPDGDAERSPREVLRRTQAVCRIAANRGYHLLPPPELTAQCL
jgi:hypothetical protein